MAEKKNMSGRRRGESGNVLFLILIAVALFAALSYAVTQSSRSGGGDANEETNLISSASITQYPASVRTAIVRMIISDNTDVTALEFNPPSDFGSLSNSGAQGVFHPSGGGATYTSAPADVMANNAQGTWYFNANFDIPNVGTSGAGGNDLIAFLPNIKSSICTKLNAELGITGAITFNPTDASITDNLEAGDAFPTTDQEDISAAGMAGQPFGCFQDTSNSQYVYYHVLVER